MSRLSQLKNSPSFIQKFKDKKQIIDREGLVKLLNLKNQSLQNKQQSMSYDGKNKSHRNQQKKQLMNISPYLKRQQLSKMINSQQERSKGNSKSPSTQNHRYSNSKIDFKDRKNQQIQGILKLPPINRSPQNVNRITKINSQILTSKKNSAGFKLKSENTNTKETETQMTQLSIPLPQKIQLDKYAIRHLQFLNRFQRQIINTRLSSGERSILNPKYQ